MKEIELTIAQRANALQALNDPDLQLYLESSLVDCHMSVRSSLVKPNEEALIDLRMTAGRIDILETLTNQPI